MATLPVAVAQEKSLSPPSTGIKSYGAYLPARRIKSATIAAAHSWSYTPTTVIAKGERTVCSWDEDVITMAVEAGRDCLLGAFGSDVVALELASTTAPYADLQNAVIARSALQLSSSASCTDSGG